MADVVNSTIPLGVRVPEPQAAGMNALDVVGKFANIQNALNQNQLFQQTMEARRRAGQIISTAPSSEAAFLALQRDPLVAPFAAEVLAAVRDSNQAILNLEGTKMEQGAAGLTGFLKAIPAAISDPKALPGLVEAHLTVMSPAAREKAAPAIAALVRTLTDNLPSDPAQAREVFARRVSGLSLGAGASPDTIRAVTGSMAPHVATVKGPQGEERSIVVGGPAGEIAGGNPFLPSAGAGGAAGSPIAVGPTTEQAAAAVGAGEAVGDLQATMLARSQNLPTQLKRLDIMQDALTKFQAGGGANFRESAGRALQALRNAGVRGITEEMIQNVANSSLSATQIFEANVKPMVIGALKEAAQGTGRVMRSEVDAFLEMMDATKDPETLMTLLNQAKKALQIEYDQTRQFTKFKQLLAKKDDSVTGLTLSDFGNWYADNFDVEKLPERYGTMDLRPATGEKVKGIGDKPPQRTGGEKPPIGSFWK